MGISVNLWSRKEGELKRFLDNYYEKDTKLENGIEQWIYVYNKPLDSIDIISAVLDNNHLFDIKLCIQIDEGDLLPVTNLNHNDIIKCILYLYYNENYLYL